MKSKQIIEKTIEAILFASAGMAVLAVCSISVYMVIKGTPAFAEVGAREILFNSKWAPTASDSSYGIAYIILSSAVSTVISVLIATVIGILTSVFLSEIAGDRKSVV